MGRMPKSVGGRHAQEKIRLPWALQSTGREKQPTRANRAPVARMTSRPHRRGRVPLRRRKGNAMFRIPAGGMAAPHSVVTDYLRPVGM